MSEVKNYISGGKRVYIQNVGVNRILHYGDMFGDEIIVNVSTRAGRMAARAYALTYLAEEPNELRGEEVYNEIIKLIGESE
jgi:ribosomal protein S11